eukprot:scaffold165355_cov25-Tisochrysis_lutea.AAC.2
MRSAVCEQEPLLSAKAPQQDGQWWGVHPLHLGISIHEWGARGFGSCARGSQAALVQQVQGGPGQDKGWHRDKTFRSSSTFCAGKHLLPGYWGMSFGKIRAHSTHVTGMHLHGWCAPAWL